MSCDLSLPPLARDANKYTRGKAVIVAGSARYTGSAVLAACASERIGAGYTEVITVPEAMPLVRAASPSLVVLDAAGWDPSVLAEQREGKPQAVCLGSGFEGNDDERALTAAVLRQAACPLVIDGTALSFLGQEPFLELLDRRWEKGAATVVTPHQGEAARLSAALDLKDAHPKDQAVALSRALHAIVVLKGPVTYVSDGATTRLMNEGTPALAKAGTGDVLAGMMAGLLAQGKEAFSAAFAATVFHARAGKQAAAQVGERSVIAEDVIEAIPAIIEESSDTPGAWR